MIILKHEYVYTWGLGIPITSQHNIFDSKKLSDIFLVLLMPAMGFELRVLYIPSPTLPVEPPHHAPGYGYIKATATARAVLPSPTSACDVFVLACNEYNFAKAAGENDILEYCLRL